MGEMNLRNAQKTKYRMPGGGNAGPVRLTALVIVLVLILTAGCGRVQNTDLQTLPGSTEAQSEPSASTQQEPSQTDVTQSASVKAAPLTLVNAVNPVYQKEATGVRVWENGISYDEEDASGDSLRYTENLLRAVLTKSDQNEVFSPISLYFALASAAEMTYGSTRDQILELLDAPSMQALRTTAQAMWLNIYTDEKNYSGNQQTCIPASSLWLNNTSGVTLDPPTAELLEKNFFTSLYAGDNADPAYRKLYCDWLEGHTGGMLTEQLKDVKLDPATVFSLVNTLYLNMSWVTPFEEDQNTTAVFHGANGDTDAVFMHKTSLFASYYKGEGYTATDIQTSTFVKVWLLLPDENESPVSLIRSGAYLDVLDPELEFPDPPEGYDGYELDLSVPKFDISASYDLKEPLTALGVKDLFDSASADFRFIETADGAHLCVSDVQQKVRMEINEKGISAAAATFMEGGFGDPVFYPVDFTLDRPFLVLVTSDCNTPLFVAMVNDIV